MDTIRTAAVTGGEAAEPIFPDIMSSWITDLEVGEPEDWGVLCPFLGAAAVDKVGPRLSGGILEGSYRDTVSMSRARRTLDLACR